jgi:hypothetical protein
MLHPEVEFIDHMPLPDVSQAGRRREEIRVVMDHWRDGFSGFKADTLETR